MTFARSRLFGLAAVAVASLAPLQAAHAQAEPFLGQIMCAGFTFAPRGWARLDGQLLSIAQNTALFSLLGTTYGGNGTSNFALPDMRGRALLHDGQGPGLSPHVEGAQEGHETVTLTSSQMPAHTHSVTPLGSSSDATQVSPANGVPASKARTTLYAPGPGTIAMAPETTSPAGGNLPVPIAPPTLTVECFIALQGVFPSRD
ncbi:phage tail protein [Scleromatobacter humisilvae]|uniref:Tail fiber protein n=1 Tax=Scleromatobacter humisilvae TaxID=2897159 RepID=A0A9X2BYB5_9BURK|nr:tail fiber protein [Scleromatobacter humisilvae]MCK9685232.1 tail fiber protein [Scleromatobacter humisilvae]